LLTKGHNFIKEAYQKLAWESLLRENRDSYFDYMQLVLIKGAEHTDEDQQAMREAKTMEIPHPLLLKCRLLFDGGYYEKASALLNNDLYENLTHRKHRLQYLYRKGRVLHALKSYAQALHYYSLTITAGKDEPYYYACSAALQSGLIHEALGSEGAAIRYYEICLQINPETYATGLHQKARMGMSRME
jgi:tetratricopeptide (TPR) repeat protein